MRSAMRSFAFSLEEFHDAVPSHDEQPNPAKELDRHRTMMPANTVRVLRQSYSLMQYSLSKISIRMTPSNLLVLAILLEMISPRAITYFLLYPTFRLVFGNLYPAYASYKAVRTKNVKEYVKWMMYWIVFALFTCAETFTDVFFSFWFPFYYEIKTILVFWLLSPATQGSSILYRRFVHPALIRRESEIDDALARATEQGYTAVLHLGTKGVNYATTVLMQTAIKQLGVPALTEAEVAITKPTVSSSARPRASSTPGAAAAPSSHQQEEDSRDLRDGIEIVASEEEAARPSTSRGARRRKSKEPPKPIKAEVISDTEELVSVYAQQTKKQEPRVTRQRLARAAKAKKKTTARSQRIIESDEEIDSVEAHLAEEAALFYTNMVAEDEWRALYAEANDLQEL